MLDTLAGWGMRPPVVVADAAYGTNAHLRAGLAQRGIDYTPAVRADVTAHPFDAQPTAPDRKGPVGCWPQPRYRHPAPSVAALATGLGQKAFTSLTWRQGSGGELRSRFAAVRVRPVGNFEGRSWPGWHHHVTLVTAAHAFLTEQRPVPKVPGPHSPSTRSSTPSRTS
ncbi:hypothetical protein GCM10022420_028860 [Streptomyces iranensis]|uniref:Transposase n=1 Tax=Streptomyces iranensis TaxID=576784 RepID=A0A061A475_9ACTN|nr:SRSO17 transposase [Streptomyces iranensis]CDR17623.1 transposase [Streptomyces iranensis]